MPVTIFEGEADGGGFRDQRYCTALLKWHLILRRRSDLIKIMISRFTILASCSKTPTLIFNNYAAADKPRRHRHEIVAERAEPLTAADARRRHAGTFHLSLSAFRQCGNN